MSGELMLSGYGQQEERRGLLARQSRGMRAVQQRAEVNLGQLVASGRHEEVKAMVFKRLSEDAMEDIADVYRLAGDLAGGDQVLAHLLFPLVQEFARTTGRNVRDFGRSRGL